MFPTDNSSAEAVIPARVIAISLAGQTEMTTRSRTRIKVAFMIRDCGISEPSGEQVDSWVVRLDHLGIPGAPPAVIGDRRHR